MDISELRPGDLIMTHKKPGKWNLIKKFFNWRLKRYSIRKYGKKCRYPHMDHSKRVMGNLGEHGYVAHWTDPASLYEELVPWMVEPNEGYEVHVFRPRIKTPPTPESMFYFFSDYVGKLYDIFDLVGMELGITRWFYGLGKKNLVCSSGQRLWDEEMIFGVSLDSKVSVGDSPPCYAAQYGTYYDQLM